MTLRVKLEIVSYGDENSVYEIGRLDISNVGYDWLYGEYRVIEQTKTKGWLHNKHFLHKRSDGAWDLVKEILNRFKLEKP